MPVYMDRHYIEGATRHAVADAHQKDLALQDKYHVKFLTYWFDEIRCTHFVSSRRRIEKPLSEPITKLTAQSPMKFSRLIPPSWTRFWVGSRILRPWTHLQQSQGRFPLTRVFAPSCSRI